MKKNNLLFFFIGIAVSSFCIASSAGEERISTKGLAERFLGVFSEDEDLSLVNPLDGTENVLSLKEGDTIQVENIPDAEYVKIFDSKDVFLGLIALSSIERLFDAGILTRNGETE